MTSYLLAGPAGEPVSLAEARAFLRLDTEADDALLTTLITAARLHLEGTTGLALLQQSWRLVLDDWPLGAVRLPVGPLVSLTEITVYDRAGAPTVLAPDGVLWDATATPPQLRLPPGFGLQVMRRPRQGIEIDFIAGYGTEADDVPAVLRQGLLMLIAYWYENRDAVLIAGSGAVVPAGFEHLVAPYRSIRL